MVLSVDSFFSPVTRIHEQTGTLSRRGFSPRKPFLSLFTLCKSDSKSEIENAWPENSDIGTRVVNTVNILNWLTQYTNYEDRCFLL